MSRGPLAAFEWSNLAAITLTDGLSTGRAKHTQLLAIERNIPIFAELNSISNCEHFGGNRNITYLPKLFCNISLTPCIQSNMHLQSAAKHAAVKCLSVRIEHDSRDTPRS